MFLSIKSCTLEAKEPFFFYLLRFLCFNLARDFHFLSFRTHDTFSRFSLITFHEFALINETFCSNAPTAGLNTEPLFSHSFQPPMAFGEVEHFFEVAWFAQLINETSTKVYSVLTRVFTSFLLLSLRIFSHPSPFPPRRLQALRSGGQDNKQTNKDGI